MRWLALALGGLLAGLLLLLSAVATLGISFELDWLKDRIETAASAALGRSVVIAGPLTLIPSVPPAAQVEDLRIGNPPDWPRGDLARLDLARVGLRVLPLLRGEVLIGEVRVEGLQLDLETDARGVSNWPTRTSGDDPGARETDRPALKLVELAELSLNDVVLRRRNGPTGETFAVELTEVIGTAEDREPMALLVRGSVQGVPCEVRLDGGSLAALAGGADPWPLTLVATAVGASLRVTGEIADPLHGKGLALGFDFTGPSVKDLETILGTRLPPITSFHLTGRIEEADGRYRIAELQGEIAATGLAGRFEADTSGPKPRLLGEIAVRSIDAGPLFGAIDDEERARTPGRPGTQAPGGTPREAPGGGSAEKVDLDEPVLTLDPLESFDARLRLTIQELVNAPATLRDAALELTVEDGRLYAPLSVTLAEVPFNGELGLAPGDGEPKVTVSLAADGSDIGDLVELLTPAKGVEGEFEHARLDLSASGESLRSLIESAELRFALGGAALSYGHDEAGSRPVGFTVEEADLVFPAADESRVTARGTLLGEAVSLELKGGTFIENFVQRQWPLELDARGGAGTELRIEGVVRRAEGDTGSELAFSLTDERIGGVAAWIGISPDADQALALRGKATHRKEGLRIRIDEARVGESSFEGEAGIRRDGETRVTFARLDFAALDLEGLASLAPGKPEAAGAGVRQREAGPAVLTIDVPILPRGIEIFDSDIEIAIDRIRAEPADITQVAVSSEIRDGYVEKAPVEAVVAGSRFEGSFGIDLRGEIPEIGLAVRSRKVDVGTLMAQLGVADGLDMIAGGFELDLAMEGASTRQILERSEFSAGITDGLWRFRAPGAETVIDIRIPEAKVSAAPEQPIRLAIDGRIEQTPVEIELTTDTLASFAEQKARLAMDLTVALAGANLELTGAAPLPVRADNLHFAMDVDGERFSDFDELLDLSLPPIGPYRLRGEFGTRQSGYYVRNLKAAVGASALTGRLDLETAGRPPRLEIDLVASSIQLDDFDTGDWSVSGDVETAAAKRESGQEGEDREKARARGRALLSPEVMRGLDAELQVEVEEVLSGRDRLGRGTLTARLEGGRALVDPLRLQVPGGSVDIGFALEPTGKDVLLEARARVDRLDYGILARRIDPESDTRGVISLDLDLKTRGPDLKRVMEGADGRIDFGLWPEDLNAGLFELWAVNLVTALLKEVDKDEASKVNCLIVRLQADNGLMRERVVFADTSKMRVEGSAEIDFRRRTLDVHAKPRAKRPEFFSLAVPVGLSGEFDDFGIDINPVVLTGKAISFITSPVHVPVRRIFRRGEPEDGRQACAEAWRVRDLDLGNAAGGAAPSGGATAGGAAPPPKRGKARWKRERDEPGSSPLGAFEAE